MRFEQFSDKHKHLNIERKELERKWRLKMEEEMLLESISQKSKGTSNAPGVGGGGGGSASVSSQLIVLNERDASTFTYYVFNYNNGTVKGPIDTGISVNDYEFNNSQQHLITNGGYLHTFYNSGNNDYAMLFIDATGNLLETVIGNTGDLSNSSLEGRYIVAWDFDEAVIWATDGIKVLTDTTTFVGVDNYGTLGNWDRTTSDGFVMYSIKNVGDDNNEHKLYLGTANAITPIFTETASTDLQYNYYCRFDSDKIIIRIYDNNTGYHIGFKVIDNTGAIIQNIVLTESTYSEYSFERFGTDKFFILFYNGVDNTIEYDLYCYNMTNDALLQTNISRETYPSYNTEFESRNASSSSNSQHSENACFVFYNSTGSDLGLSEVDYLKYVGYFATESDFVTADFAEDETKYVLTNGYLTSDVFLAPVDNEGTYSMLIFDSSGTLNYVPFLGIDSGNQQDVNAIRAGSNLIFSFANSIDNLYYIYVINSDASSFYLLDEEIEEYNLRVERDTILVRDNINDLAWYFNSVSTGWTSTNIYNLSGDTTIYTTSTRITDGNVYSYSTNRIYYFNDMEEFGNDISDGGDDMYDTGNIINTNLALNIEYTHTQMDLDSDSNEAKLSDFIMDGAIITSDAEFGVGSSYFTNLYPGLFVLSASDVDITDFSITGDIGADGNNNGQVDNYNYTPTGFVGTYKAYIKRVWDANDPSINHIIIVNTDGTGITQAVDTSLEDDDHELSGLGNITKIHYLLFAKADATKVTDLEIENIINSYLEIVDDKSLVATLDDLNSDYSTITANLPPKANPVQLNIYRRTSVSEIEIDGSEDVDLGKDIFAYWYYDTDREEQITVKLYNYAGTLLQTIETNDESMNSFDVVENRVYLSTYTKYFDPIESEIYYTYNFHHLSQSGKSTITKDVLDNTGFDWIINDYVWWND
jgi:hypothetical protein